MKKLILSVIFSFAAVVSQAAWFPIPLTSSGDYNGRLQCFALKHAHNETYWYLSNSPETNGGDRKTVGSAVSFSPTTRLQFARWRLRNSFSQEALPTATPHHLRNSALFKQSLLSRRLAKVINVPKNN
jgi:hypothetical protein